MVKLMMEPTGWAEPDAAQERRTLIEAFHVEDLQAATAHLRARCQRLEHARCSGEVITVGEVAEVLLSQWSVAFHTRLADSQRAFFILADPDRSKRAAQDARAAATAVRDRYLAPGQISRHCLQQALNLANEDASGLRPARTAARQPRPQLAEAMSVPAADRAAGLIAKLRADRQTAARSHRVTDERARDWADSRGMSM